MGDHSAHVFAEDSPSSGPSRGRKLNCTECRRLKLKCSRQWPCSECVRRGTSHLCPEGSSAHGISKTAQIHQLQTRVAQLESLLRNQATSAGGEAIPPADLKRLSTSGPSPRSTVGSAVPPWAGVTESVGQLTWKRGGNSRFYGVTAAEHHIVSPEESEDEAEDPATIQGDDPAVDRLEQSIGWPLKRVDTSTKAATMSKLLACLPSKAEARALEECYWEMTCWRFEPFTRSFYEDVLQEVYPAVKGSPPPHPHKLALVFAVLALSELVRPYSPLQAAAAARYHACTRSCLTLGGFLKDISVDSLAAMHLICGYTLNADGRSEELYVLVGLMLRLGMAAGFHRDGSWWNLEQPGLDHRRRVWWEICQLERVHSFSFGLPLSIPSSTDTARPSSLSPISFLWWKWDLQVVVSDMLETVFTTTHPTYDAVMTADKNLRSYDGKVPVHLRCTSTPLWKLDPNLPEGHVPTSTADYILSAALGDEGIPLVLRLQQIRLATLYNIAILYLHRSSFTMSLHGDPLEGLTVPSFLAVVLESSTNIINLVSTILRISPRCVQWGSNVMDLFGAIACQAATLIRRPLCALAPHCRQHLQLGVDVMNRIYAETPLLRVKILLQKTRNLCNKADASLAAAKSAQNRTIGMGESNYYGTGGEFVNPVMLESGLGDLGSTTVSQGMTSSHQGMSNIDFDAWILDIIGNDNVN